MTAFKWLSYAFLILAAACGSSTATGRSCTSPDYVGCPNYPASTVRIVNQSNDSSVNLVTVLPTPGAVGDSVFPGSDVPLPGQATCQLLGRWQPDTAVLVAGFSGHVPRTRTNIGLFNLRSSPGWVATFDAGNVWHFNAATACTTPGQYTF